MTIFKKEMFNRLPSFSSEAIHQLKTGSLLAWTTGLSEMMTHGWGLQVEQNLPTDLLPVSLLTMHQLSFSISTSNAQSKV
jgi:hypothetical protein